MATRLVQIESAGLLSRVLAPPPAYHMIPGNPPLMFVPDRSRLYSVLANADPDSIALPGAGPLAEPPAIRFEDEPSALTLNIAQTCNLACSYCYADEGRFGTESQLMPAGVARQAIHRHIHQARSRSVTLGFIGGEPLLNRPVLYESVAYAVAEANVRRLRIGFGITTNGALVSPADISLFQAHAFAVSISVDGGRATHDSQRRTKTGDPSFDTIVKRIGPLLSNPGMAKVTARATLSRRNLDVSACLNELASAGFAEVGFSPLTTGPDASLCLTGDDWPALLAAMSDAGRREWDRVKHTRAPLRFSNLATAWKQLYRGACDPLPCRSAAGYVSLSADGSYYTCHRTIGKPSLELGDLTSGPSREARWSFAGSRHVDQQEPCRSCWARYLCGGGCHAEVIESGRPACDYIRGWLEFCISLYPEVLSLRPDLLRGTA